MNLNNLTEKAQDAMIVAQNLAEERRHTQPEPEHVLAARSLLVHHRLLLGGANPHYGWVTAEQLGNSAIFAE